LAWGFLSPKRQPGLVGGSNASCAHRVQLLSVQSKICSTRLALASGALLLVASTWLYERPLATPSRQASTLEAQESLFEAPPPVNQDDVLLNTPENNP